MQATPASVYDAIVSWSKEVDTAMPAGIVSELKVKCPGLMQRTAQTFTAAKPGILNLLKSDASFNILAGCMVLRWMFERFSNNGTALFNRALVAYNAGAYTASQLSENPAESKKLVPNTNIADTLSLVTNTRVPQESKYYLVKMLGIDGFLDLIYGQKLL
jgi:soluble lytic murein transglycosylase-like protein